VERNAVVNLIACIIGALGAIVFVGYFAIAVGKLPLIIIAAVCLGLMVYSFYDDLRNDPVLARFNGKNSRSRNGL
jgi:uncharacterized membrane protein